MSIRVAKNALGAMVALGLCGIAALGGAQDKPADNLQILRDKVRADFLRDKVRADKKLLVATNMELTESEPKGFWPIYAEYQKELHRLPP